jgi:transcriptional regulator with XRE-family HTH domain
MIRQYFDSHFPTTGGVSAGRIGISENYLSTMEHGKVEVGAEILLRISREFAKRVEWLLTGKD